MQLQKLEPQCGNRSGRRVLDESPRFEFEERFDRRLQQWVQMVSLVEEPVVTLPLNFQDSLPRQGVVDFIHEKGYGFVRDEEFPSTGPRVFMPPRVAAQFSRGDRVRFATSGDTGRVTEAAHAAAGYTLTPLFPPLDHAAEPQQPQQQPQQQQQRRDSASAAAASASAVASQLLFSFAVNKATRQVEALSPRSAWFPRLEEPGAGGMLPLTMERKLTLKWPQRMGVGTVLQAVDLHHVDPSEFDVICFRKTLASLMDATLDQQDPSCRNWFAANTYSVTKQLQKVTFLMQVLPGGTMLLDEGFDDTQVMMNRDSFGRQFERACVPRQSDTDDVKSFQAFRTQIDGVRVLVCTPPDAMTEDEQAVEIKLRLPPLFGLTDREEFCMGLTSLRLEMLGFGEKSSDGARVTVTRVERRTRDADTAVANKYGRHLARVLRLMAATARRPGGVYLMRRRKASLVVSRAAAASFYRPPPESCSS